MPGSAKPEVVLKAMHVGPLRNHHKVRLVGTQLPDEARDRKGFWRLFELLAFSEIKPSAVVYQHDSIVYPTNTNPL